MEGQVFPAAQDEDRQFLPLFILKRHFHLKNNHFLANTCISDGGYAKTLGQNLKLARSLHIQT